MNTVETHTTLAAFAALALSASAAAQITIPSDGSDGAFNPASSVEIDLSLAPTASWDTPGNGNGVYDAEQWAIVFKFTEVNVPSGVTVTFTNHPSYAPVIWLVQGDVVIDGTVSLNGATGHGTSVFPRTNAEPGPGGFRGGRGSASLQSASSGFGPGGGQRGSANGNSGGSGGSFATLGAVAGGQGGGSGGPVGPTYGNEGVFPLIGGSGAAGGQHGENTTGGGGGGGAILIAAAETIHIAGILRANGGNGGGAGGQDRIGGGGSGGAIRLIADFVSGNGIIEARGGFAGSGGNLSQGATGGNGGAGRIRVEANTIELAGSTNPDYSAGFAGTEPRIFRDTETPIIRSVTLAGVPVPADPEPTFSFPTDVIVDEAGLATLVIEGENVPEDATVQVRITRRVGATSIVNASFISGNSTVSIWHAEVDLASGFSAIQVRADLPDDDR